MELESEDGAVRIPVASLPKKTEIGRGAGFAFSDRTVSRHHIAFHLDVPSKGTPESEPLHGIGNATVSFEVIGRNPILVLSREGVKKIFRTSEVGKLGGGDRISPSLKNPFFFFLRCGGGGDVVDRGVMDAVKRREKRTMERRKEEEEAKGSDTGRVSVASFNWEEEEEEEGDDVGPAIQRSKADLSHIDPVKEFGFLVMGHEFDHCRRKICDMKSWNWLLQEHRDGSDGDQRPGRSQKRRGRMNKRGREDDDVDEDWTEESGAEKTVAGQAASKRRAKYLTRSKDQKRPKPDESSVEETKQGRSYGGLQKSRVEEDDEEDESLGGFIVGNEEEEERQDEDEEEEEEEDEEEGEEFDGRDEEEDD